MGVVVIIILAGTFNNYLILVNMLSMNDEVVVPSLGYISMQYDGIGQYTIANIKRLFEDFNKLGSLYGRI